MKQVPKDVKIFTGQWRALQNIYTQYARKLGLTTSFIDVLDVLYEKQPCTQKKVMDTLFLPKQTVSFVIKKLRENNFISMKTDSVDKRRNVVIFTQAGSLYAQKVIEPFIEKEEKAMQQLTADKRNNFNDLFKQYVKHLNKAFGTDKQ